MDAGDALVAAGSACSAHSVAGVTTLLRRSAAGTRIPALASLDVQHTNCRRRMADSVGGQRNLPSSGHQQLPGGGQSDR